MTEQEQPEAEERAFFDRADSFIKLANDHADDVEVGRVSASFMFGLARFNAFVCAGTCKTAEEMKGDRERALEYFVAQYRRMFEENFDDYMNNFGKYMQPGSATPPASDEQPPKS